MMTKTVEGKRETGQGEQPGQGRALPEGWRWVKLGGICEIFNGFAFKSADFVPEGIPVLKMGNVGKNFNLVWNTSKMSYLPQSYLNEYEKFIVQTNDLLITLTDMSPSGEYLGTVAIFNREDPALLNQRVGRFLLDKDQVDSTYLYFRLRSNDFRKYVTRDDTGNLQKNTNPQYIYNFRFPLPPIAEQKRIVGILSDRLAAVEQARQATQAQLEAAQALPAAYLRQIFNSPEAQTWEKKPLGDVANVTGGIQKTPGRKPNKFHKPYLTVRNVQRGYLDLSEIEQFELTPKELERYKLQKGDLLIVEGNGSVNHIGRNAIYQGEIEDCVHQNHIIRVRLEESRNNPEFISLFLNSELGKSQMLELAETTSGLYTLSVSKVSRLQVLQPERSRQVEVVKTLQDKMSQSKAIVQSLQDQLDTINALPAALLRQAFNGEL